MRGRPVFNDRDWLFLTGHPRDKVLSFHLWLRFAVLWFAVVLIGFVEGYVLLPFGLAAFLGGVFLTALVVWRVAPKCLRYRGTMTETQTPEEIADLLRGSYKNALSGIIAIDGRDGAGKSCLAKKLQKLIGGGIVSLDHFLKQNQGGYIEYLDQTAIRAAIDGCTAPKILEGVCVLEVLNSVAYEPDVLIYVKRSTSTAFG
jgi:hypothetical protein